MKDKANKLFTDASKKLNEANEELFKPKEDLVTYMVCKNAQFAIENYLKGFLLQNGVNPAKYKTVESLHQQCIKLNNKFEEVDLSDFNCKSHDLDSRYCNEVSKVSNCFDIADNLDTFLRREKIID
ncbi:MAG: HEPN domain-containing protein [Aureibaculum sp.]|jgi:HEPN domain-containing protein